jgi:holo-[acyl-carrier protein] synthase
MEILGHGIDIVEIARVNLLLRRNDDFLLGWFTSREIVELNTRASQAHVIAGRVAAKEATAKAIGTGFAANVSWQDLEVLTSECGAPLIEFSGEAEQVAKSLGVSRVLVSISHERSIAVASAIAIGSIPSPNS